MVIDFSKPFIIRNDFGKKVLFLIYKEHVFHGVQRVYLNQELVSFEVLMFHAAMKYKNGAPLPFGYEIYNVEFCTKCGALLTNHESCERKMGGYCYEH